MVGPELHQAAQVQVPVVVAVPEIWVPVITVRVVPIRPVAPGVPALLQVMVAVTEDPVQRPIITADCPELVLVAPVVVSVT